MKVSAVVPVYNSINTLERAIKSLLIQPEINEILIVDDGSTDGSYEFVLELESKNPIIKVLTHPNRTNKGASASRNLGLTHCSNNWIQFLDADDELLPNKISSQTKFISNNFCLIISNSIWINSKRRLKIEFSRDIWLDLIMAKFGNTCSNLWNKSIIISVGGWNENLINTQEYDLMFRMLKYNSSVVYVNEFLTIIYQIPNSISRSSYKMNEKFINQVILRKDIESHLKEMNVFNFKYKLYLNGYLGTLKRNYRISSFNCYNKFYFLIYKTTKSIKDRL